MTATDQDIGGGSDPWVVGDYKKLIFAITDQATGLPATLAGVIAARWGLYPWSGVNPDTTASFEKAIASGVTLDDPVASSISVEVQNTDTESLSAGRYFHELEVTDAQGKISTFASGKVWLTDARLRP